MSNYVFQDVHEGKSHFIYGRIELAPTSQTERVLIGEMNKQIKLMKEEIIELFTLKGLIVDE